MTDDPAAIEVKLAFGDRLKLDGKFSIECFGQGGKKSLRIVPKHATCSFEHNPKTIHKEK